MKINTTTPDKQKYLQILTNIAKPPQKLHYVGTLPSTRIPTVAIVGTRKPTRYGQEVTYKIAYELAQAGLVVVSGLALGVDAIAHRAALEAGGKTIAVLANGLPDIRPATNRQLGENIIKKGGAIISEYDELVSARSYQFLERNRIVSGLSDAVIITEAASRSGTLSTAARALEQGKDVFVVPGNITSPLSAGCNALLRQGATPLIDPADVLEQIAPDKVEPQTSLALGSTPTEQTILQILQSGVRDGDELQQKAGINSSDLATALTMLEIAGSVRGLGGNQWTLR